MKEIVVYLTTAEIKAALETAAKSKIKQAIVNFEASDYSHLRTSYKANGQEYNFSDARITLVENEDEAADAKAAAEEEARRLSI